MFTPKLNDSQHDLIDMIYQHINYRHGKGVGRTEPPDISKLTLTEYLLLQLVLTEITK